MNLLYSRVAVTRFGLMAVRASREILIEAPLEAILDALADVPNMPSWSPVHTRAEVIDTYPDGRPFHVRATFRVIGLVDREVLEYHWGRTGWCGMPNPRRSSGRCTWSTT